MSLNDNDLILLNEYIDGQLSQAEREALEQRLAEDPALRREYQALRATVALLAMAEPVRVPRNFTLDPTEYGSTQPANLLDRLANLLGPGLASFAAAAAVTVLTFGGVLAAATGAQGVADLGFPTAAEPEVIVETVGVEEEGAAAQESSAAEAPAEEPAAEEAAEEEAAPEAQADMVEEDMAEEEDMEESAEPLAEEESLEDAEQAPTTAAVTAPPMDEDMPDDGLGGAAGGAGGGADGQEDDEVGIDEVEEGDIFETEEEDAPEPQFVEPEGDAAPPGEGASPEDTTRIPPPPPTEPNAQRPVLVLAIIAAGVALVAGGLTFVLIRQRLT